MSTVEQHVGAGRRAAGYALSATLLAAGIALALTSGRTLAVVGMPLQVPPWVVALALLPVYVVAERSALHVEFRRDSHNVTMAQLPVALGVQVLAAPLHLPVRLAATLVNTVQTRTAPHKAFFNLAAGAFEVGAASFAVSLVGSEDFGPASWLALYLGVMAGEVVGQVVLDLQWRLHGLVRPLRKSASLLLVSAPLTALFTGLAIVASTALRVEPATVVVMLALAAWLGVAYRSHRRLEQQQATTEQLYALVKDLGPLQVDGLEAVGALDQVRELLHAERLELAVPGEHDASWQRLVVADGRPPRREREAVSPLAEHVASTRRSALTERAHGGGDTMATPLLSDRGLVGILTASDRLGSVRGFDDGDLTVLDTVAAELAVALERGRLQGELQRAATTDALTGLHNLRETTRHLAALLATHPEGVVLAAVAVDSFREVNDTLGHTVGDELLLEVTRRLQDSHDGALLGRIGGGRFAVAVPSVDGLEPSMMGLELRSRVEGAAQIGAVGTHVRLSVGVVCAPDHGTDAATLIRRAETAMYSARDHQGGPVVWEPAYEVQGQRRLAVVSALREALASGAIGVHYQPKVEALSGTVSGVEALARWTHPALGAITPDEFIPLAEASGLMGQLTSTVLRQSLTACKGWQRRGGAVGVAVNVSADTVLDPGFVTEVADILRSTGVAPGLLTLELTEGVVVSDPELAAVRMGELRELGLKISIDDFGTGYSSLTYLKGLPIDEVKVDKGFIDGLTDDPADRAVVRAVVDIAHTLGLRVVAEGVEQEAQMGILRALGVDEVQGYLHARPMPALDAAGWLRRREAARTS